MTETYGGEAISPGIGMGPASVLPDLAIDTGRTDLEPGTEDEEWERFRQALDSARDSTRNIRKELGESLHDQLSDLFAAQETMLEDPLFLEIVKEQIYEERQPAESAVVTALEHVRDMFKDDIDGDAIGNRVLDLVDVGWHVLSELDTSSLEPRLPHGGVLVSPALAPGVAVRLENSEVEALVVQNTDRSSHTAVVAQALEMPAVGVPSPDFFSEIEPGDEIVVAANRDRVIVNPTPSKREEYKRARREFYQFTREIRDVSGRIDDEELPCAVRGNLGLQSEVSFLEQQGGHGAGLVRTELMFTQGSEGYPGLDRQTEVYRCLANDLEPYPVTVRTFDVGGDKEVFESLPAFNEDRGRGIQRSLRDRDTFVTQLEALVEAYARHDNLKILIPMVGDPGEIREVSRVLDEIADERGVETPPLGVMIEIPSSLFYQSEIIDAVDFLSVGTNDLLHYLLGSDRFEEGTLDPVDAPDPALFRALSRLLDDARSEGLPVGVCGELAGNPVFTPAFVGLGVHELSMSPIRIPEVKLVARNVDTDRARELAEELLTADERSAVRSFAEDRLRPIVRDILQPKNGGESPVE